MYKYLVILVMTSFLAPIQHIHAQEKTVICEGKVTDERENIQDATYALSFDEKRNRIIKAPLIIAPGCFREKQTRTARCDCTFNEDEIACSTDRTDKGLIDEQIRESVFSINRFTGTMIFTSKSITIFDLASGSRRVELSRQGTLVCKKSIGPKF